MAGGVRRISLADIYPGLDNSLLVGVIIATQNVRTVSTRKDMSVKGVWNFTFRDSEADFINATLWGSPEFVSGYAEQFHIGDVVAVVNARVTFRVTGNGSDDSYRPVVSSPFQLTLSEGTSEVHHHNLPDMSNYLPLLNIPTKTALENLTLRDLNSSSGESIQGTFVNLLVAVRNVQKVRQIQMRDGRQAECREVVLFDETCSGLTMQIWDREYIIQASQWKPRETVLYMTDIRLKWDSFRHTASPCVSSKTIITVNPQTPEAECLKVYALAAPLQPSAIIDHLASNIVDVCNIKNVLSVRTILARARADFRNPVPEDDQQFTALLYAVITHLDIDHENIVLTKCSICNKVSPDENSCSNPECPVEQGTEMFTPLRVFNLRVSVSDHTGTLKNCRLNADAAETVLRCSVSQFDRMTSNQKTSLKWSFLLERCAIRVLVLTASQQRRQPCVSVLSCAVADLSEVASRLPIL